MKKMHWKLLKVITVLLVLYFRSLVGFAQSENPLPQNSFQLLPAYSLNGTDNVAGFAFTIEYTHHYRKKLSWSAGFGTTVHDGSLSVEYYTPNGTWEDGTVYFVTSGVQASFSTGYSFVRTAKHVLHAELGALVRYQTSSNPEREGIHLLPIVYFEQLENYRTFSWGGIGGISYAYTFKNNVFIIAQACLQIDTNDDAFNMFGLGIGKRLGKFE